MAHRRPVALAAAVVLVLEAAGVAWLHWVLGVMVDRQDMSLAGLDPHAMTVSTWIGGALFGACLLLCGMLLLRTALADRPPGRAARALLTGVAVVHGVLGAVTVGLVGWAAFGTLMAALGLIVLALVAYGPGTRDAAPAAPAGPADDPGPGPGPPLTPTTP